MSATRHDYLDGSGDLRVSRELVFDHGKAETVIGHRRPGRNSYIGISRWGKTWDAVRSTLKIEVRRHD
jgi:hypothetical protein